MGLATELERSIAELVGQHAAEQPDAIAIEDGERPLSYAELDAAAAKSPPACAQAESATRSRSGVCLPRSWQAVCALVGAVRAGAAYVPIASTHPAERQRGVLELAGAGWY